MTREELKELIRCEPGVTATLDSLEGEYAAAKSHFLALDKKRDELLGKLEAIAAAKAELAAPAQPAASVPDVPPEPELLEPGPSDPEPLAGEESPDE